MSVTFTVTFSLIDPQTPGSIKINILPKDIETMAHRELAFQIFIRFLMANNINIDINKKEIDEKIVSKILQSLVTSNKDERESAVALMRHVYLKCIKMRPYIRQQINILFHRFIYVNGNLHGISELLEIANDIISGYNTPLKADIEDFLLKILLPLHNTDSLAQYHGQLSDCVVLFVSRYPVLTATFVRSLIKIWPKTFTEKEILLLDEIEDILATTSQEEFLKMLVPLFCQIIECAVSPCYKVAERALLLCGSDGIMNHMEKNHKAIMPIVFPALYRISHRHCNAEIKKLVCTVLKMFLNINKDLFMKLKKGMTTLKVINSRKENIVILGNNED
ncbi:serine/threonine-protein phosphatase 2A 56 kDa regulatory subunit epsilon isoform [Drosophila eugracilis]|uniref:serine/threonine-protein phosphatase 2A 56 kDa regulatory subunit epsilon isoform n=1 Tax=Drosophila eugracilis TaxID=29029 RepID=UPI0007E848FF|nr:serine/threonine-protein phosphatase 2A 56 kDa regulatory subunit epsilon isoform [Drosophila eugracilis]